MILVDTSVWIDHLRRHDDKLCSLLETGQVLTHAFIVGELALGSLANRSRFLQLIDDLPRASTATDDEVRLLIENHALAGAGIGYTDAHLLAAAFLNSVPLWTHDKRLSVVVEKLGLSGKPSGRRP